MFWKIYFWILSFILFFGYVGAFPKGLDSIHILVLIISIPSLVGFFLYAYKKSLFTAKFWRFYFIIYIFWDLYFNLMILPGVESNYSWPETFIGFLLISPMWIALYLYAFKFLNANLNKG